MLPFIMVFVVLTILCCIGIIKLGENKQREVCQNSQKTLSFEETRTLRGVAMFIIMFSHLAEPSVRITFFFYVSGILGVAICFLVSGYGLGKGYKYKENYLSHFLLFKFLNCLLPYVVLYIIYAILYKPDGRMIFYEILRLQMAGNPLWYLKVQLLMYLLFFCIYRFICNDRYKLPILWTCCIAYCIILYYFHVPSYWYETCLYFPVGVWLSNSDHLIIPVLRKRHSHIAFAITCFTVFVAIYFWGRLGMELLIDEIYMLSFVLFMLGVSYLIKDSIMLAKVGEYSLEIYLVHCLVLRLDNRCFVGTNAISFISLTVIVLAISVPLKIICQKCIEVLR